MSVRDSGGSELIAPLYYAGAGQVNFVVPEMARSGAARISLLRGSELAALGSVNIDSVAPSLFSANANGQGVAAAVATRVSADGAQSYQLVFTCGNTPGSCVPAPIDLASGTDEVYLSLYGSGIQHRSGLVAVSVTIGGVSAEVLYAGPQPETPGLDQVNVKVPKSLAGRGEVDVVLAVDGKTANTVKLSF